MKLTLHTEFTFDAAHRLVGHDGKCNRLHGHTWLVRIWIKGSTKHLNKQGILWDFGETKQVKNLFDHYNLNDVMEKVPSCENIVEHIYGLLTYHEKNKDIKFKVRVYENAIHKQQWCEGGDW